MKISENVQARLLEILVTTQASKDILMTHISALELKNPVIKISVEIEEAEIPKEEVTSE